jgi:toxin ParE1/3/4
MPARGWPPARHSVGTIRSTRRARADLLEIWEHVAAENPAAADRVLDRIQDRLQILASWPKAGSAWSTALPDARVLVAHPYLILYREIPDGVQVVRVLHGARNIGAALFVEGLDELR